MKRIITIVGARPQFIKAAMLSRAIADWNTRGGALIKEEMIHTGQHYDENMSRIFFSEMGMLPPKWQLQRSGTSHGAITGQMLIDIERILLENQPDFVVVYGDTDSTLAGALAASKLHIPIVHIEAGLRSFNKTMPEEQNRILTDHLSDILCCPTQTAVRNLAAENIRHGVHHVGDIMYDAALFFGQVAERKSTILRTLNLGKKAFYLCTIHRAENTDDTQRLSSLYDAVEQIASPEHPVVFPLHPRTRSRLEKLGLMGRGDSDRYIHFIEPLGFLDMIVLEKNATCILTDSGGVQKEAYFHRTPCVTLRAETEWVETVTTGWNQLADVSPERIAECLRRQPARHEIGEYGDGHAAEKILRLL